MDQSPDKTIQIKGPVTDTFGEIRLYIIAGEASGDLHASNVAREIRKINSEVQLRGWGGDLMQAQGVNIVKHYRDLAFMGFIEVLMNLRTILKNIEECKSDILQFKPDALLLVDYPGFNLRIAEWAFSQHIPVYYYISPQIWAWKKNRVYKIKKYVREMFVVLPFEQEFYNRYQFSAHFVGHPLLDVVNAEESSAAHSTFISRNKLSSKPVIALLPGSRKQEISSMLPLMLSVAHGFPEFQFVVAGAPGQDEAFYSGLLKDKNASIVFGQTYDLLQVAAAGLVTSGTATLEAALFRLPQVVCYKASAISYFIARQLIRVKFISLVNLILDRTAVTELIQADLNKQNIAAELRKILEDESFRNRMLADYQDLHNKLGGPGASAKVARLVLKSIGKGKK